MGNMFFENDGKLIDKYNKTLHILEKIIHAGPKMEEKETDVDLCLKIHFGNNVVAKMLWSSEPPCIRGNVYSKIPCPDWFNKFYYSPRFEMITMYLGLVGETVSYYIDLVKDISIMILFCHVTYQFWNSFSTFVEYAGTMSSSCNNRQDCCCNKKHASYSNGRHPSRCFNRRFLSCRSRRDGSC